MDREDQGREFCEKFKNLAPESEPDGYKAIKRTLAENSKSKSPVQYQRDEDSSAFTLDHEYQRETPPMQETSEQAWVYPQSSSPPRDPATLPTSGEDTYRFCHETRGFAVLIINSEFDSQSKRRSAVNDENYMNKMFEELNFDVHVLRNLSSKELEDKMKGISISVPIAIKTN
uniref:Caspase family p20 domain-containing protein n=1 Tax=Magallana gigas TaxID=29159 RepID=K1P377_MAGGI